MRTIETIALTPAVRPAQLWRSVAEAARSWLAQRELQAADAVLLVPFADLIGPARRALAIDAKWLPRMHTPRTLATALGPPIAHAAG
ncbi:MAG TPA: hypothetical protein VFU71_10090, partial [Burkholderiaceae bacterium]|nr:hypothetical protein [Burkholderiaceae bacterium]